MYETRAGITANVLNFGNLVLQTAGETVEIDMDNVPNPSRLREMIFQQIERSKARDLLRSRGQIREMLARRLHIEKMSSQQAAAEKAQEQAPRRMWFLLPFSLVVGVLLPAVVVGTVRMAGRSRCGASGWRGCRSIWELVSHCS